MGLFDFLKSNMNKQSIDITPRWRSAYSNGQSFIYDWDANEGNAKIPIAYKAVLTDVSHDATNLHKLSGLKDVKVPTVNGNGDLWVSPCSYSVPIGKTEHKTLLLFFYKNETGLKALSINLTADYASLLRNKERLIMLDAITYLHLFNEKKQSKIPIDILLKNTKCLLPLGYIEEMI